MKSHSRLIVAAIAFILGMTAHAGEKTPVQRAPGRTVLVNDPIARDERAMRAGAKLFARECAACHGAFGEGHGRALPLRMPEVRDAAPGVLFWVLTNGSLGRGMPSFANLPEAQRWQIITFLKDSR
jgi:mono/diheme cytochrome c family protein